eukprot:15443686-Alexandrium_andersonii.AAC.1
MKPASGCWKNSTTWSAGASRRRALARLRAERRPARVGGGLCEAVVAFGEPLRSLGGFRRTASESWR